MSAPAPSSEVPEVEARPPAWWDVHGRLMPDYNRRATAFWWAVTGLGSVVLAWAATRLAGAPLHVWLQIGACTLMAMLAGLLPVRVPKTNNSFTAGEIFIFLLLLTAGVEAAVLACSLEALVGSWRTSRRWTSRIISPALAALAMGGCGWPFQSGAELLIEHGLMSDALLLIGAIGFALLYFVVNTLLVTTLPLLKRRQTPSLRGLFRSYGGLAIAYAGGATMASFLYLTWRQSGMVVVIAAVPSILILLTTGHYYFRRKEAEESAEAARLSEAEQFQRHLGELERSERRFHSAFTHASIGMALVSFDGGVRQANAALSTLIGLAPDDTARLDFAQFVAQAGGTLEDALATLQHGSLAGEYRYQRPDGQTLWLDASCSFFSEPGSDQPCLVLQLQDISARRQAQADLNHIAFHDGLTGLPNRHRFNEHLSLRLARANHDGGHPFSVLFLDFDRFKLINDSLGHTAGDEFLVQVSRRIEANVREGDLIARLGGDEFAILAEVRGAQESIVHLAERLQRALGQPFSIAGTEITTSASMGITFSSLGYQQPDEMLRDADIAMYKAKSAGKARHAVFDVSLHQEVSNRLKLEGELRRALAEGTMSVDYQPLFDLASGAIVGFEALSRWRHAELGNISPAVFIPIAEESGAIVQLTEFVLTQSCQQLRRWQSMSPAFDGLKMHINVAANDMASAGLPNRVARALLASRLKPECISIELTENILMERLEASMGTLDELHALGVGLSVDDFGTGYSSLSHLSNLPIDCLKIDRSFVVNLRAGSKEAAVIRAIVSLGKSLGKEVIAEGIETVAQRDELRDLGCDVGQGYLLARPQPAEAIDRFLADLMQARRAVEQVLA